MTRIPRRTVLQRIAATAICSPAAVRLHPAAAALPPLPNLPASDALLLRPGDAQFAQYEPAFNARTMLTPQLRAMCKTPNAVGVVVDWCRSNNMPFAVRCGEHSYEGFSQSASVVIDLRLMNSIAIDVATKTATVGAGASLGQLYQAIATRGFAFPGGAPCAMSSWARSQFRANGPTERRSTLNEERDKAIAAQWRRQPDECIDCGVCEPERAAHRARTACARKVTFFALK